MAVAKANAKAVAAENAVLPPSLDLATTALVFVSEALAVLKAAKGAALVFATEAAAALKADEPTAVTAASSSSLVARLSRRVVYFLST